MRSMPVSLTQAMKNAAIDSFIVKTCRDSTAKRMRKSYNYKDPDSSWGYGTKGFQYGRKAHVSQDIDSTAILEYNNCIIIGQPDQAKTKERNNGYRHLTNS